MKENTRKEKLKIEKNIYIYKWRKLENKKVTKKMVGGKGEGGGWRKGGRQGFRQGGGLGSVGEKKHNFILGPCHEVRLSFIPSNKPPNELLGIVHWWVLSHSCPWIWVSTNNYLPNPN